MISLYQVCSYCIIHLWIWVELVRPKEDRLRPLIGAGFHIAILYSDSSVHIIFHQILRVHAAPCSQGVPDLRMNCGSRLVNTLVVWGIAGGCIWLFAPSNILPIWPLVRA